MASPELQPAEEPRDLGFGSVVGGGIGPILATSLFAAFHTSAAVSLMVIVIVGVGFFAMLATPQRVIRSGDDDDRQLVGEEEGRPAGARPVETEPATS